MDVESSAFLEQDLDETSNCAASMALGTPNGLKP